MPRPTPADLAKPVARIVSAKPKGKAPIPPDDIPLLDRNTLGIMLGEGFLWLDRKPARGGYRPCCVLTPPEARKVAQALLMAARWLEAPEFAREYRASPLIKLSVDR